MSLIDRVLTAITPGREGGRSSSDPGGEKRGPDTPAAPASSGLVTGGPGAMDRELLIDGQEEVFSRTEVELGRIEHRPAAEGEDEPSPPFGQPHA